MKPQIDKKPGFVSYDPDTELITVGYPDAEGELKSAVMSIKSEGTVAELAEVFREIRNNPKRVQVFKSSSMDDYPEARAVLADAVTLALK